MLVFQISNLVKKLTKTATMWVPVGLQMTTQTDAGMKLETI
jgi:hypothetical protein